MSDLIVPRAAKLSCWRLIRLRPVVLAPVHLGSTRSLPLRLVTGVGHGLGHVTHHADMNPRPWHAPTLRPASTNGYTCRMVLRDTLTVRATIALPFSQIKLI